MTSQRMAHNKSLSVTSLRSARELERPGGRVNDAKTRRWVFILAR